MVGLHALCHYRIKMGLPSLGTGSDFTMAVLSEVCDTDSLTFSACRAFYMLFFLLPKTFEDSEMTNTMTTAHPQPHQDVLFLNTGCCNQHYSCQAILWPDVLHQLHNSIGGPQKKLQPAQHYPPPQATTSCPKQ